MAGREDEVRAAERISNSLPARSSIWRKVSAASAIVNVSRSIERSPPRVILPPESVTRTMRPISVRATESSTGVWAVAYGGSG
jgi:hypothetical protein